MDWLTPRNLHVFNMHLVSFSHDQGIIYEFIFISRCDTEPNLASQVFIPSRATAVAHESIKTLRWIARLYRAEQIFT